MTGLQCLWQWYWHCFSSFDYRRCPVSLMAWCLSPFRSVLFQHLMVELHVTLVSESFCCLWTVVFFNLSGEFLGFELSKRNLKQPWSDNFQCVHCTLDIDTVFDKKKYRYCFSLLLQGNGKRSCYFINWSCWFPLRMGCTSCMNHDGELLFPVCHRNCFSIRPRSRYQYCERLYLSIINVFLFLFFIFSQKHIALLIKIIGWKSIFY